tara:strand:- start:271 stop:462 length:192 start_codon:yes stop_codon:yes gene_type:complete
MDLRKMAEEHRNKCDLELDAITREIMDRSVFDEMVKHGTAMVTVTPEGINHHPCYDIYKDDKK